MPDVTPGWKTSEFWVTVIGIISVTVLIGLERMTVADLERLWPLAVGAGSYAISRGMAKGQT